MKAITTIKSARAEIAAARKKYEIIGFVPTMGALHEGHLSLVRKARSQCGFVVVSIFVNPTQFGPGEDLGRYPRTLKRDISLLKKQKADMLFCPSVKTMYGLNHSTFVEEEVLSAGLCGASRPGHFRGVCTVVTKLFNIVQPDRAYFGQKDFQQARVVERMAADLNMPVSIKICPVVREKDGLAMSSRNCYLTPVQRAQAPVLYAALRAVRNKAQRGMRSAAGLKRIAAGIINSEMPDASVDYIKVVDYLTLQEVKNINRKAIMALAVYLGKTRLIDNIIIQVASSK